MSARNDFGYELPPGVCDSDLEGPQDVIVNEKEFDSYDEEMRKHSFLVAYQNWCREHPLPKEFYDEPITKRK